MIFDVETDGLLNKATKIHVLSYRKGNGPVISIFDYDEMRQLLLNEPVLIGHNIICFDVPVLEKILGIKIKARLIDTLALSWSLNHTRIIHGLESYGDEFGVPKPKIEDWEGLTSKQYAHRCEEDVKINTHLWKQLKSKLLDLYGHENKNQADKFIRYLSFKMDCLREQERSKWKLNLKHVQDTIDKISPLLDQKTSELKLHMPVVIKTMMKSRPSKPYKKDGSLSVQGVKWNKLLKDKDLPEDYDREIEVVVAEQEPNPNSSQQVKDWLSSIGWVPSSFNFSKDSSGGERKIPQIRVDGEHGKELCPSVRALIEKNPSVGILDGVTVLSHRLAILQKFLKDEEDGWIVASASGLTNTLRLKHRVLVNLPGVDKEWGEEIRGSLVAPEGFILCGSDMSSLEDSTKKHYMYKYDPTYVNEMASDDFDPHLDLAKFAGVVSAKEVIDYVTGVVGAKNLKPLRKNYKVANYACIYGVGPPKLARTLGVSKAEAQTLIDAYWGRNWAVTEVVKNVETKKLGKELWLLNPVSGFWYSLRNEKDIFSTLNQGTGVYCFDSWIREFRSIRSQLTGQFHDEVILCIKKGAEEKCKILLQEAITRVNKKLNLNVTLGVDIQFGGTYADIH